MKKILTIFLMIFIMTLLGCSNKTTSSLNSTTDYEITSTNESKIDTTISDTIAKDDTTLSTTDITTSIEDIIATLEDTTTVIDSSTLVENKYVFPNFYVNTDYGRIINSKETYIHCLVSTNNSEYEITDIDAGIRGRGNSTWAWDKKPYRVKFDSKVDLFNNGKAKSWTLIANHCDLSLSRNYLAFLLSRNTDSLEFTSSAVFVNFYLNNQYQGLYLVCDQIQSGKTRININEELNGNPSDTGYLIEMDVADRVTFEGGIKDKDFFTLGSDTSKAYVLKTPDTKDVNYDVIYLDYIKYYMTDVYTYLISQASEENYNALSNLIDMNTFADTYILSELFNNCDVGWSMYMYKDKDEKLKSGPIWDFDISSGNCAYHPKSCDPNNMWARSGSMWYSNLLRFDEFKELVASKLESYKDKFKELLNTEVENLLLYEDEFNRNFEKWDILGKGINMGDSPISTEELLSFTTWKEHILYLKEWLFDSIDAMVNEYCS